MTFVKCFTPTMLRFFRALTPAVMAYWTTVLILLITGAAAKAAERYPEKPIRIIVPSGPGGGPDVISRMVGAALTQAWGQQVVTDNRAGAAGNIGAEIAARAVPDGYTLLMASGQQIIAPLFFEKPPYHLMRDFSPVCLIVSTPFVLVINPSVAATSVKELVALAKAKPATLHYGSSGTGGTLHLLGEMFKTMADINVVHVPYKSSGFMLVDVVGGQIQFAMVALPAAIPLTRQGKLRALGVASLKRTALAPELEPIADTVPGYESTGWFGLVAPIRTPGNIIAMLNAEIVNALKVGGLREKLLATGVEPVGSTPREFAAVMVAHTESMRKTIHAASIRAD